MKILFQFLLKLDLVLNLLIFHLQVLFSGLRAIIISVFGWLYFRGNHIKCIFAKMILIDLENWFECMYTLKKVLVPGYIQTRNNSGTKRFVSRVQTNLVCKCYYRRHSKFLNVCQHVTI